MNRTVTIGTLFNGDLRLHWSWLVFPVGVAAYALAMYPWQVAAFDLVLLLSVYLCILIHEGAQFLSARHYGLGTRDVTLYPFWGVARLGRMGERPWQECYVAAAGPIVLALLAAIVGAGLALAGCPIAFPNQLPEPTTAAFLVRLFWAVVLLAALHMLPLLPLDGGRVLRASIAMRSSRLHATEIAAIISTVGVLVLLAVGIVLPSPLLVATAVLLFLGGQEELNTVRYFDQIRHSESQRRPAAHVPVDQIISPDCRPDDPTFTGFTWNASTRLWIEWHEGRPVAVNALIGDGRP